MQKSQLRFPKKFLWGASVSAHQVEGNQHNQWSVWELENAKSLSAQAEYHFGDLEHWQAIKAQAKNANNYISGDAADHYNRFEEDFENVKHLGLNAFRFSIEWSRIEPTEGVWNAEAIEHYRRYIQSLKQKGIEPMLTLFHFTVPVWFAELGGFEKRRNVKYFIRFAEKVLSEIGKDVRYVITINEPEVYAWESYVKGHWPPNQQNFFKGYIVLKNLIYAHNKTAKMIHRLNRRYKVSIAKNSSYVYAGDDALLSRISARVLQYFKDDFVLSQIKRNCDFIGLNYYFSDRVYGYRVHNPDVHLSDLGWDMQPENIEYVLERLFDKYKLPIIVTENGLADAQDASRKWWIGKTMIAMANALNRGVKLQGYFHWSLVDNFEWAQGFWPNFGLVAVDARTKERSIRPSAMWWAKLLKQLQK